MPSPDVLILGAGLAGLSAGVELAQRGRRVLVLEQRPYAGGRTRSFVDPTTGDTVDNGQHLMMGCYAATRRYLSLIGSDHLTSLQPTLRIDFIHPGGHTASLTCPSLPAPLHVGVGMLDLSSLSLVDRLKLLQVGAAIVGTSPRKEQWLDTMTVDAWLTHLGQSESSRRHLWDIIAIGALNERPEKVSALLFFRVLRAAFLHDAQNASMLIPRAGLSEVLIDPAVRFIEQHGGIVRTGQDVTAVDITGDRIRSVRTEAGTAYSAPATICALPFFAFERAFPASVVRTQKPLPSAPLEERFRPSTILGINLWFDRDVMTQEFAALLGSRIHWVFNRTRMTGAGGPGMQLSLTVSGADEYDAWEKDALVRMGTEELRRYLPRVKDATLRHAMVMKEKRATFVPEPGLEAFRPRTDTTLANLFLAGDWTDTGYPATIEGAVLSGQRAAERAAG